MQATEVERDDKRLYRVLAELERGCVLTWRKHAGRYFIDTGEFLTGPSLSRNLVAELEQEGTLRHIGADRYALKEPSC